MVSLDADHSSAQPKNKKNFGAKQIALQLLLVYIPYTENQYLLKELPLRHLGLQMCQESLHIVDSR